MTEYAGWVPTITGQLSFSLIGLRASDSGYIAANRRVEPASAVPHRVIAVVKRRVTRDVPWPFRLFHPERIKTCILLGETGPANRPVLAGSQVSASVDDIGALNGTVYVVPHHHDQLKNKWARRTVREITMLVSRLPIGGDVVKLKRDIEAKVIYAEGLGVRILQCTFSLLRTGEVRIDVPLHLPQAMAEQMYYFVKDCAHRHYHHRGSTDNLLPLTPSPITDDISWRRDTLWCLTRSVLEARRRDSLEGYKSALGMLAYADAFQALLGKIHRPAYLPDDYALISNEITYDFAHTKSSLDAKVAEREFSSGAVNHAVSFWVTSIMATLALWMAAVQIKDAVCVGGGAVPGGCSSDLPEYSMIGLTLFITKPHYAFGFVMIIAALYFGPKLLKVPVVRTYTRFLESWAQAAGATVSRKAASVAPALNDRIGAWVAAGLTLIGSGALVASVWALRDLLAKLHG